MSYYIKLSKNGIKLSAAYIIKIKTILDNKFLILPLMDRPSLLFLKICIIQKPKKKYN
jgi:hypothetical protein